MIEVSQWVEYGVLATVIGALFCVIAIGFKMFINLIAKIHDNFKEITKENKKQHSEDLKNMQVQHREERSQWSLESDKRDQRYEASMKEFSQAIRDLRDKI